jgi:two-component system, chemotaxis family, chemotaxis protein CheY
MVGDRSQSFAFDWVFSFRAGDRILLFRSFRTIIKSNMKKILVVDDSETIRTEVGKALGPADFSVLEARDGVEGLGVAAQNPDLALIVLDVNMPVMNGLDMLDRLKQEPKTEPIPVVLLTTEAQESLIERAKKAGAKGWLIKPVKPEILLAAVKKLAR